MDEERAALRRRARIGLVQSAKAWRGIRPPEEWLVLALASDAGRIAGPAEVQAVRHLVWGSWG